MPNSMTRFLCAVLSTVRRLTISLPAVAVLAGCAADTPPPPMHVAARVENETVKLAVENIPTGREIVALVLVDDRGGETPARQRELITRQTGSRPHVSLGYLFRGSDTATRSQRMTAEIALPDPAAYGAGYRDWRIVVRYRDQLGEVREVAIPAPAP